MRTLGIGVGQVGFEGIDEGINRPAWKKPVGASTQSLHPVRHDINRPGSYSRSFGPHKRDPH